MKKHSIILLAISILLMIAMLITTLLVDRSIRSKEATILATATAYVPTGRIYSLFRIEIRVCRSLQ